MNARPNSLNTTIVTYSDCTGGAAKAALRLHHALLGSGFNSRMKVRLKKTGATSIDCPTDLFWRSYTAARWRLGYSAMGLQKKPANKNLHSANWLPSRWSHALNADSTDVVNLHWIGGETMSIEDVGKIVKPVLITMHDMWTFCGAEHYAPDTEEARWVRGYEVASRHHEETGFDLDRWTWLRKKKAWKRPMQVVSPSRWLADCARRSALLHDWPISVIPNPLETELYAPCDSALARDKLGLPKDKKLIMFGAVGGRSDPRKGYQHLVAALHRLKQNSLSDFHCVIFGESEPANRTDIPFPASWMGHISDERVLVLLYSAADVMVVPSEQENLPQTATEAQSCGCPVVGFNCGGMPDAVQNGATGVLAEPYDAASLARAIKSVVDRDNISHMRREARLRAVALWAPQVISRSYAEKYMELHDGPA